MTILALDPGNEESALVELDLLDRPVASVKASNSAIRESLLRRRLRADPPSHLAIEMIASYGMPVGREVFETCMWVGRFVECWCGPFTLVYRREVKMFLCGNNTAKDSNIRQALLDLYGGKEAAVGKKASPGPLYGISGDEWAALAVGVTWARTRAKEAA